MALLMLPALAGVLAAEACASHTQPLESSAPYGGGSVNMTGGGDTGYLQFSARALALSAPLYYPGASVNMTGGGDTGYLEFNTRASDNAGESGPLVVNNTACLSDGDGSPPSTAIVWTDGEASIPLAVCRMPDALIGAADLSVDGTIASIPFTYRVSQDAPAEPQLLEVKVAPVRLEPSPSSVRLSDEEHGSLGFPALFRVVWPEGVPDNFDEKDNFIVAWNGEGSTAYLSVATGHNDPAPCPSKVTGELTRVARWQRLSNDIDEVAVRVCRPGEGRMALYLGRDGSDVDAAHQVPDAQWAFDVAGDMPDDGGLVPLRRRTVAGDVSSDSGFGTARLQRGRTVPGLMYPASLSIAPAVSSGAQVLDPSPDDVGWVYPGDFDFTAQPLSSLTGNQYRHTIRVSTPHRVNSESAIGSCSDAQPTRPFGTEQGQDFADGDSVRIRTCELGTMTIDYRWRYGYSGSWTTSYTWTVTVGAYALSPKPERRTWVYPESTTWVSETITPATGDYNIAITGGHELGVSATEPNASHCPAEDTETGVLNETNGYVFWIEPCQVGALGIEITPTGGTLGTGDVTVGHAPLSAGSFRPALADLNVTDAGEWHEVLFSGGGDSAVVDLPPPNSMEVATANIATNCPPEGDDQSSGTVVTGDIKRVYLQGCSVGTQTVNIEFDGTVQGTGTVTVVSAVPPPGTPGTPTFSSVTLTGFTASWAAGANATGYVVQIRAGSTGDYIGTEVTGASHTFSGLIPNTAYEVRVKAIRTTQTGAVGSPYSAAATQSTSAGTPAATSPGQPGELTFSRVSSQGFTVSWAAGTDAAGYVVEIRAGSPGSYTATALTLTAHDFSRLAPATTYEVRVKASRTGASDGIYRTGSVTTFVGASEPVATATPAPTVVILADSYDDLFTSQQPILVGVHVTQKPNDDAVHVQLSWERVPAVESYEIQIVGRLAIDTTTVATSHTIRNVPQRWGIVEIRVRGKLTAGDTEIGTDVEGVDIPVPADSTGYSPWSNPVTVDLRSATGRSIDTTTTAPGGGTPHESAHEFVQFIAGIFGLSDDTAAGLMPLVVLVGGVIAATLFVGPLGVNPPGVGLGVAAFTSVWVFGGLELAALPLAMVVLPPCMVIAAGVMLVKAKGVV